ncbi:MAG: lamin tail domain-containing protein [Candidatus Krumholzibacteria bacterium]|nr:lamin tail domain-containing protein [Candidatus Krumholzibacteria bacterium]
MRRGFWRIGLGVTMLGVIGGLALGVSPARSELVINEFLANPGRDWDGDGVLDSRDDEWVEVYNPGPDTVNLTVYWLRDGLNEDPNLNLFGELGPQQTAVFYGSHAAAWQQEHGGGAAGLSLNNGGDTVVLMKTDPADPLALLMVDSFQYTAHVGALDRACGRLPDGDDWTLFDGLNPYAGGLFPQGNGCEPTPGENNVCGGNTALESRRWSEVKTHWQ